MNTKTVTFTLLLFFFSAWGYLVGMLDYRLMITTAKDCICWIKLALLMGFATLFVAWAVANFIISRSKKLSLETDPEKELSNKSE